MRNCLMTGRGVWRTMRIEPVHIPRFDDDQLCRRVETERLEIARPIQQWVHGGELFRRGGVVDQREILRFLAQSVNSARARLKVVDGTTASGPRGVAVHKRQQICRGSDVASRAALVAASSSR